MASGKLSPRQKMINMMYLVLTALLALNVSKEIMLAFFKVETGLEQTSAALSAKNAQTYDLFATAAKTQNRAAVAYENAKKIRQKSTDMVAYLGNLRQELIDMTGGYSDREENFIGDKRPPAKMDDKEIVANYLLQKPKKGEALRIEIEKFRDFLMEFQDVQDDEGLKGRIAGVFDTSSKRKGSGGLKPWEVDKFEGYPLIAILTFITQIESDVVKTEAEVVDKMFLSAGKSEFTFDKLSAVVIAPKTFIMSGDSVKAEIFVTAYDSQQQPEVEITGKFDSEGKPDWSEAESLPVNSQGKGILAKRTTTTGEYKFASRVRVVTKTKGKQNYDASVFEYTVSQPTAVVSPTKMNVFYRGVANPLEVSVPGVAPSNIVAVGSGVNLRRTAPGKYEARVGKSSTKATISVKANGKTIGKPKEFRVKKIPNPLATVGGIVEGKISKNRLLKTPGVRASLKDFPFDLKFRVSTFTVRVEEGEYVKPIIVKGDLFNQEVKAKFKKIKPGRGVSFTNIKATSTEKGIGVKTCSPVVLTVQ
jgi:gliding motility-associated protein GldM